MSTFNGVERVSMKESCWARHSNWGCWVNAAQWAVIKIVPWHFEGKRLHLQLWLSMYMCILWQRVIRAHNTFDIDIVKLSTFISDTQSTFFLFSYLYIYFWMNPCRIFLFSYLYCWKHYRCPLFFPIGPLHLLPTPITRPSLHYCLCPWVMYLYISLGNLFLPLLLPTFWDSSICKRISCSHNLYIVMPIDKYTFKTIVTNEASPKVKESHLWDF